MKKFLFIIAITLISVSSAFAYTGQVSASNQAGGPGMYQSANYYPNTTSIGFYMEAGANAYGTIYGSYRSGASFSDVVNANGGPQIIKSGTITKSGTYITNVFIEATATCSSYGYAMVKISW